MDTPATLYEQGVHGSLVDVVNAENEFNALAQRLRSPTSNDTIKNIPTDPEKGEKHQDSETFDLREYLTSSNDAHQQAGIKHKVSTSMSSLLSSHLPSSSTSA